MILALKIALVIAVSGLLVFIADYTRMTRGAAWRDPVGLTIILAELFLLGTLMPLLLASFFQFSTLGNEVGSWILIVFIGLSGAVMYWRTLIFELIHRRGKKGARPDSSRSPEKLIFELVITASRCQPVITVCHDVAPLSIPMAAVQP